MRRGIGKLLTLLGIGVLLTCFVSIRLRNTRIQQQIMSFKKESKEVGEMISEKELPPDLSDPVKDPTLLEKARQYNEALAKHQELSGGRAFTMLPSGWEAFADHTFAIIEIPRLHVELPVYLGASEENLSMGAALLTGTSLPVSGDSVHSVIAGHREYRGSPFFRDLPQLKPGDSVRIHNLWEQLDYEVISQTITDPADLQDLYINEGKELLTLVTCDPYYAPDGIYQRMLVLCKRV